MYRTKNSDQAILVFFAYGRGHRGKMNRVNRFEYNEEKEILIGVYNLSLTELDLMALHNKVLKIIQRKRSLIGVLWSACYRLADPTPVTPQEAGAVVGGVLGAVSAPQRALEYEKEAQHHLERIKKTSGPLKIPYMESYVSLIRKYLNVSIGYESTDEKTPTKDGGCPECSGPLEGAICIDCGLVTKIFLSPSAYMDSGLDSSTKSKTTSDAKANFLKRYRKYKGDLSKELPSEVVSRVAAYFAMHRIQVIQDEANRLNNLELVYKALLDEKLTKYNNDINLVCHKLWGWPLPNLSHLDDRISQEFDLAQEIIERNKGDKPTNVINGWRLWRHLMQAGYECDPREFKIPKTQNILKYYEDLWEAVCSELGWSMKMRLY